MPIDYETLMNWPFKDIEHTYTEKDTILYALGVGLGSDPVDRNQLRFVYEEGLEALPTMAVVLAYPGFWLRDPGTGVSWEHVLHGEQGITLHRKLAPSGTVTSKARVTGVIDKGKDKGALILVEREIRDSDSGELVATLTQSAMARKDGGFGGPREGAPVPHTLPEREPDVAVDLPTLPQAALLYRLSGDYNPLHADPKVAIEAGFKAPILHGLCTFGVAGHALLKAICSYDPARLRSMNLRFSAPVYPGETIRTEMWRDEAVISFRARVVERDVIVLNNGYAEVVP